MDRRLQEDLRKLVGRMLDRLPHEEAEVDFASVSAAVWRAGPLGGRLVPRGGLDRIELGDLHGIGRQKARVERNTRQFVAGLPANNALLWGARGTGKSSLVHALLNAMQADGLRLVELGRDGLAVLPEVLARLAPQPWRFIVFCDDLSFEADDPSFKSLKSVLDGSVFTPAENVVIYATSNRRHLLPEFSHENLETRHAESGEVHPGETSEEKVSLSDRFGLWVSFQSFRQEGYLEVAEHWVRHYARRAGTDLAFTETARAEALRWALGRGNRSGRTANQFARHWVGSALLEEQARAKP